MLLLPQTSTLCIAEGAAYNNRGETFTSLLFAPGPGALNSPYYGEDKMLSLCWMDLWEDLLRIVSPLSRCYSGRSGMLLAYVCPLLGLVP